MRETENGGDSTESEGEGDGEGGEVGYQIIKYMGKPWPIVEQLVIIEEMLTLTGLIVFSRL